MAIVRRCYLVQEATGRRHIARVPDGQRPSLALSHDLSRSSGSCPGEARTSRLCLPTVRAPTGSAITQEVPFRVESCGPTGSGRKPAATPTWTSKASACRRWSRPIRVVVRLGPSAAAAPRADGVAPVDTITSLVDREIDSGTLRKRSDTTTPAASSSSMCSRPWPSSNATSSANAPPRAGRSPAPRPPRRPPFSHDRPQAPSGSGDVELWAVHGGDDSQDAWG